MVCWNTFVVSCCNALRRLRFGHNYGNFVLL